MGTLLAVILVMVAAAVMVFAIATRFAAKDQYTAFGHPTLVVLSGSMTPVIDTGDLIIDNRVTSAQANHLRVGQIITFFDAPGSKMVLTHRIVRVVHQNNRVFYETKGDFNNAPDAALRPASDVIGVYEMKIPRGGYFLYNLHRPLVLGLLLAAPVLWFVAGLLRQWGMEIDQPERDARDGSGDPEGDMS